MEVGYTTTPYVCSFVGCDGFDRTLDYATYDVLLYRFPTTSDFYCAVKNNVMKQVEERKAEVAAKTASTTVVKSALTDENAWKKSCLKFSKTLDLRETL